MKYHQIEPMCRPLSMPGEGRPRGCPHDGLGCTGGQKCSINQGGTAGFAAYNASGFGPDFICAKHQAAAESKGAAP